MIETLMEERKYKNIEQAENSIVIIITNDPEYTTWYI